MNWKKMRCERCLLRWIEVNTHNDPGLLMDVLSYSNTHTYI